MFIEYFIITFIVVTFLVWLFAYRTPNNTDWERCMYCKDCKTSYPQHGFHPSVYDCPSCAKKTTYAMYKYANKELLIKER